MVRCRYMSGGYGRSVGPVDPVDHDSLPSAPDLINEIIKASPSVLIAPISMTVITLTGFCKSQQLSSSEELEDDKAKAEADRRAKRKADKKAKKGRSEGKEEG